MSAGFDFLSNHYDNANKSRTLRIVNVLDPLVFSNNIKKGIGDIRDSKRRITACP